MSRRPLWVVDLGLLSYPEGLRLQRCAVDARLSGATPDVLLFVEHSSVITLGRRSQPGEVVAPRSALERRGVAVCAADRGGHTTFHGPGQLVGYPILALEGPERDAHVYLRRLEAVLIRALATWGITASRDADHTGVWVGRDKLAAIGVALRRWVTYHGFALNVAPDPAMFDLIVPCGITDRGVASVQQLLGWAPTLAECSAAVTAAFAAEFGREPLAVSREEFLDAAQAALAG